MRNAVRLIITAILIFTAGFLYSEEKRQSDSIRKQPSIESYEINPNPVGRGDLFTITIVVDHDSSADVDFPLEELPGSLLLWRGPYIRSFIDTDKSGESIRKVRITTTFKPQKSGRMILPAFSVLVNSKRLQTEARLLNVGLYKNRKLYMPIEVEWRSGFEKIYAGEAVPVYLTVMNQEVVTLFDRVRVALPRDGFFEKASGVGTISSTSEGRIILYDIPAAAYIYTVPVAGEVRIPSAGVDLDGITGWTDNLDLKINRVPDQIKDSGAVGAFSYNTSVDRSSTEVGEDIVLNCTVEGDGNLNYLKLPEPEIEGGILVSKEELEDYDQSEYGFSGSKSIRWIYKAEKPGTAIISVPGFSYLMKQTDNIESFSEKKYSITVAEAAVKMIEIETEQFPFSANEAEDVSFWHTRYKEIFRYIWLLPGFIFYVLVRVMKKKRILLTGILSVLIMIAVISAGQFFQSEESLSKEQPLVGKLYNKGIEQYNSGEITDALHNIRTAIYLNPVNSEYRAALNWIEDKNGFVNSIQPSIRMHPDIFYFILVGVVNLFFLAAVLKYFKSGGFVSVLQILFGFLILFSIFMIVYTDSRRQELTAVICAENAFLKKIPKETAETWMPIISGTAIRVVDESEKFFLIETGLGLKGWITEDCIITDRPEISSNQGE